MKREYALKMRFPYAKDDEDVHSHTEDENIVRVWRERKPERVTIVWREVGDWQDDEVS